MHTWVTLNLDWRGVGQIHPLERGHQVTHVTCKTLSRHVISQNIFNFNDDFSAPTIQY